MIKMDKGTTQGFVRAYTNFFENIHNDPTAEAMLSQSMIDSFLPSSDPVLDELRRQELDMQLLHNQARAQLLTYCQRQVAEMNQNKAPLS